jgi:peptidoglycan hydrolase-like protein with peptidoglycan-binding domain
MIRFLAALGLTFTVIAAPALASERHGFAPPLAHAFITDIQEKLAERGFYNGEITGDLDPATRKAIVAYQRAADLAIDGRADPELSNHLNFGPVITATNDSPEPAASAPGTPEETAAKSAPRPDPFLLAAQKKLRALDLYTGEIDGLNGPKTRAAIRAFGALTGMGPLTDLTPEVYEAIMAYQQPSSAPAGDPSANSETADETPAPESAPAGDSEADAPVQPEAPDAAPTSDRLEPGQIV